MIIRLRKPIQSTSTNTGLSVSQVNQAIANDVINRPVTNGVVSHGSINVGGINIFYDYYTRSKDVINVGTYYAK